MTMNIVVVAVSSTFDGDDSRKNISLNIHDITVLPFINFFQIYASIEAL